MKKIMSGLFACVLLASLGCKGYWAEEVELDTLVAATFEDATVVGKWQLEDSSRWEYLLVTVDGRMLRVVGSRYMGVAIQDVEELGINCQATTTEESLSE